MIKHFKPRRDPLDSTLPIEEFKPPIDKELTRLMPDTHMDRLSELFFAPRRYFLRQKYLHVSNRWDRITSRKFLEIDLSKFKKIYNKSDSLWYNYKIVTKDENIKGGPLNGPHPDIGFWGEANMPHFFKSLTKLEIRMYLKYLVKEKSRFWEMNHPKDDYYAWQVKDLFIKNDTLNIFIFKINRYYDRFLLKKFWEPKIIKESSSDHIIDLFYYYIENIKYYIDLYIYYINIYLQEYLPLISVNLNKFYHYVEQPILNFVENISEYWVIIFVKYNDIFLYFTSFAFITFIVFILKEVYERTKDFILNFDVHLNNFVDEINDLIKWYIKHFYTTRNPQEQIVTFFGGIIHVIGYIVLIIYLIIKIFKFLNWFFVFFIFTLPRAIVSFILSLSKDKIIFFFKDFLKMFFWSAFLKLLTHRSILNYTWSKYDLTYERLIKYPSTIFKQYIYLSILDMFLIDENSFYYKRDHWSDIKAGLNDNVITSIPNFYYWDEIILGNPRPLDIYPLDDLWYLSLAFIALYHIYFWGCFIFKQWYYFVDKYDQIIGGVMISILMIEDGWIRLVLLHAISPSWIIWLNATMIIFLSMIFQSHGLLTGEESEDTYDLLNEPDNWGYSLWAEFTIYPQAELFCENYPADFNWEYREDRRFTKHYGYSMRGCEDVYKIHYDKQQLKLLNMKKFYQYDWNDWKLLLTRKSSMNFLYNEKAFISSWEKVMAYNNPFGNYDINQFTLFGLIPKYHEYMYKYFLPNDFKNYFIFKILVPEYISLPWYNGLYIRIWFFDILILNLHISFTPDFLEFTLTPLYMFIKNPWYTFKHYEAPYLLKNWVDLEERGLNLTIHDKMGFDDESVKFYWELADQDPIRYWHRIYGQSFSKGFHFRVQRVLGDNYYGGQKLFADGLKYYWDFTHYTSGKKQSLIWKAQIWRLWGLLYGQRRLKTRQKIYSIKTYWESRTILEHIFFRKRVAKREFKVRVMVEELMRQEKIVQYGVDRRCLKTIHRKRFT